MATTINDLLFEMERRVVLFSPITKMPDESALGYNADPNDASSSASDGQFLLYNSPVSTRYSQWDSSDNVIQEWAKVEKPNVWNKLGSTIELTNFTNIAGGDASIYYGNLDSSILFRPIEGGNGINISTSDNIIIIDASGSGNYDSTLLPSITMPTTVGGYPSGTDVSTLLGDSLIKMFDNLLFPTVDPTYVNPSCQFVVDVSGGPASLVQEVRSVLDLTFISSLDKGSIDVSEIFQAYRSGDASIFFYNDPSADSLLVDTNAISNNDTQYVIGYNVFEGIQTFSAYINYKEGPQPVNNKNVNVDSSLSSGDTSPLQNLPFEGVYPYFATTVDVLTLTKQPLTSTASLSLIDSSLAGENDINRQTIQFPDNFGLVSSVNTWNTTTGQWQVSSLSEWTITSLQIDINGSDVTYNNYEYNSSWRDTTGVRFYF